MDEHGAAITRVLVAERQRLDLQWQNLSAVLTNIDPADVHAMARFQLQLTLHNARFERFKVAAIAYEREFGPLPARRANDRTNDASLESKPKPSGSWGSCEIRADTSTAQPA